MTAFTCISLHQPWASALFLRDEWDNRLKINETRSFAAPRKLVGQRIAIHAAKHPIPELPTEITDRLVETVGEDWRELLPSGAVIGTIRMVSVDRMADDVDRWIRSIPGGYPGSLNDRRFGDWTPGRWAWRTVDERALPIPIPARGRQGWFTVEIPE